MSKRAIVMGLVIEPRLYPKKRGRWGWGGRLDILAEASGLNLDGLYLFDWKSGKKPTAKLGYPEWPLQTSGYRQAAYDSANILCDGHAVIHLDKFNGMPTIYDYSASFKEDIEAFILLARFWHNRNPKHIANGLPSCTTITGILDKPFLRPWAANMTSEYMVTEIAKFSGEPIPSQTMINIAERAKGAYRKKSEQAMGIGTEVHKYIEDFLKHGTLPNWKFVHPSARTAFDAFTRWYEQVHLKVIEIELRVYGRFDTQLELF